jgi:hypothetical protein
MTDETPESEPVVVVVWPPWDKHSVYRAVTHVKYLRNILGVLGGNFYVNGEHAS